MTLAEMLTLAAVTVCVGLLARDWHNRHTECPRQHTWPKGHPQDVRPPTVRVIPPVSFRDWKREGW